MRGAQKTANQEALDALLKRSPDSIERERKEAVGRINYVLDQLSSTQGFSDRTNTEENMRNLAKAVKRSNPEH